VLQALRFYLHSVRGVATGYRVLRAIHRVLRAWSHMAYIARPPMRVRTQSSVNPPTHCNLRPHELQGGTNAKCILAHAQGNRHQA